MKEIHDWLMLVQNAWWKYCKSGLIPVNHDEILDVTSQGIILIAHSRNGKFIPHHPGMVDEIITRWQEGTTLLSIFLSHPALLQFKGYYPTIKRVNIPDSCYTYIASLSEKTLMNFHNAGVPAELLVRCGGNFTGLHTKLPKGATVSLAFLKNAGLTHYVCHLIKKAHELGYHVMIPVKCTTVGAIKKAIEKYGLQSGDMLMTDYCMPTPPLQ